MINIVYLFTVHMMGISFVENYDFLQCRSLDRLEQFIVCRSDKNKIVQLPDSVPTNIRYLVIETPINGTLAITDQNMFRRFNELSALEIKVGKSFHIAEELLAPSKKEDFRRQLFDLPSLEGLSIEYMEFNKDNNLWITPSNLVKLYSSNTVMEFDLNNSIYLEDMSFYNNELSNIPISSDSVSQLETLDLKYNPLYELNVKDIAGFCKLHYLGISQSNITHCECLKLKDWISKLVEWGEFTFDGDISCNKRNGEDCSSSDLDQALSKRESCLKSKRWDAILSVLIVVCVISTLILFVAWLAHNYDRNFPAPPSIYD